MNNSRVSGLTDCGLWAIMAETGNWVVTGPEGRALCAAASLGHALDRATLLSNEGASVMSISRLPPYRIHVPSDQIARLRGSQELVEAP